jgi:hypothetical protein
MPVGSVPSYAFLQVSNPLAFSPTQDDVLCGAARPSRLYIPLPEGLVLAQDGPVESQRQDLDWVCPRCNGSRLL